MSFRYDNSEGVIMKVESICNRNVITAERDNNVLKAAEIMRQNHVGSIVIVDVTSYGEKPIGIVSDRDIVIKVVAKNVSLEEISLNDIMARDLVCVRGNDDLMETLRIMCMEGVRRVPVINNEGALMGLLSMDDLFEIFANELSNIAVLICRHKKHEKRLKC